MFEISHIVEMIKPAVIAVLDFIGSIWFFIKLNALRKMSKRFLANSKMENFKEGNKLAQKVRRLFALVMFLDALMIYFLPFVMSYYLKISAYYICIALVAILIVHIGVGLPIVLYGNKAEILFRNMYPPVPKAEVYKKPDFNSQQSSEEESFYEVAETQPQKSAVAFDNLLKDTEPENTDEIIEYDDEGYVGAWRLEKSSTDITEEKEREEEAKTKECPFCGTLNGINNRICDFCGADIPK